MADGQWVISTSDNEREEEEMRQEREKRWPPTNTKWDLVPAVIREPRVIRQRTDIMEVYTEAEFRMMYRCPRNAGCPRSVG